MKLLLYALLVMFALDYALTLEPDVVRCNGGEYWIDELEERITK